MNSYYQHPYQERWIPCELLEVPYESYQRPYKKAQAQKIANHFDDRLLNDPKVSKRNGRYYVFDGQHTLAALKILFGTEDFMVRCRVFEGLTAEDEADLFAAQFGASRPVPPGYLVRASVYAQKPTALSFKTAVESAGLLLSYSQRPGENRIACITTAFNQYCQLGDELFIEALSIIKDAWNGTTDSLRAENISAVCQFVYLYRGEYDRSRLVKKLEAAGPLEIYQKGSMIGNALPGTTKYLMQVFKLYNGTSRKHALPLKF